MPRRSRSSRRTRWRRIRRWTLVIGLVVVLLLGVGALIAWDMSRQAPTWWRELDLESGSAAEAARTIEDHIASEMHEVDRPADASAPAGTWQSEPWSFALTAADANAWLNTRLWSWLANRDERFTRPDEIAEIQVDFDEGLVRLGARVRVAGREQIVTTSVRPEIRADGALWLPARSFTLGRLGLPSSMVLEQAGERLLKIAEQSGGGDREFRALVGALTGKTPLFLEPVVELSGGRRVRLLSVRARQGYLEITCRTEHE